MTIQIFKWIFSLLHTLPHNGVAGTQASNLAPDFQFQFIRSLQEKSLDKKNLDNAVLICRIRERPTVLKGGLQMLQIRIQLL